MSFDASVEDFIYGEIENQSHHILEFSKQFNVDPRLIISLIYVERIQYKLDIVRDLAKKAKSNLEDLIKTFSDDNDVVKQFFNSSRGFSHIKFLTAKKIVRKYKVKKILTDYDLGYYETRPDLAIKLACAIVGEHILMWKEKVPEIEKKIDILATLYNISDFENKTPHENPQKGGSVLANIVDGEYKEASCFADRVVDVYHSKRMADFLNKIQINKEQGNGIEPAAQS